MFASFTQTPTEQKNRTPPAHVEVSRVRSQIQDGRVGLWVSMLHAVNGVSPHYTLACVVKTPARE